MPQSSFDPVVAGNLKAVLEKTGRSPYSVSKALGRHTNWLYRVINVDSGILIPRLREVAEEIGVPVSCLVDPFDEDGPGGVVGASEVVRPGAGPGRRLVVPGDLLRGVRGPWVLSWMRVLGDCLFPELPGGSTVLIDRTDRVLEDGGIYLLKMGEELVLRRVGSDPGLGWVMRDALMNPGAIPVGDAWVAGRVRRASVGL